MFKRVLIANRGEIALRIQRSCRELGIETVAVYSEPDRNSLHVRHADHAICIGPGPALESYLVIEKIIDAALQSESEAIHPGYGFLSENSDFADACKAANITFIGPPSSAMKDMGDKVSARHLMEKAGVPVVPGADDIKIDDMKSASDAAIKIGFPLMVKASAGGGGRGIRLVHKIEDLENAMRQSASEAQSSFGNPTIFLEKYVSPARHIEVQIMADGEGNVRAFGERECSIQRRHQKVIEEAPSIAITPEMRKKLCQAAELAALSCGYQNAGTVEFLMGPDNEFYFLEMNARLQVEHPVTELVYGVDLVALQLSIASGGILPDVGTDELHPNGWAIEARINGENAYKNFVPSIGLINHVTQPSGPGVRFDSMLYDGLDVPPFYDSMLGKLIVWAENRDLAIQKLMRALNDLLIVGIDTNIPFHKALLKNLDFQTGNFHTGWLEEKFIMPPLEENDPRTKTALVAAAIAQHIQKAAKNNSSSKTSSSKWVQTSRYSAINISSNQRGSAWRRGTALN